MLAPLTGVADSQQSESKAEVACAKGQLGDLEEALRELDASFGHQRCLQIAAQNGHAEVVRWLLGRPEVDPSAMRNKALRDASEMGHLEVLKVLREDVRSDPSDLYNWALIASAMNGHLECLEFLLAWSRSVDPSAENSAAIGLAAKGGHAAVVSRLMADPRVQPFADDSYALRIAAKMGHVHVVEILLKDPRVCSFSLEPSALRWASEEGHCDMVRKLLDTSPLVMSQNGEEALLAGMEKNRADCVKELLQYASKVQPYLQTASLNNHAICFIKGALKGSTESVRILLELCGEAVVEGVSTELLGQVVSDASLNMLAVIFRNKALQRKAGWPNEGKLGKYTIAEVINLHRESSRQWLRISQRILLDNEISRSACAERIIALAYGHQLVPIASNNIERFHAAQTLLYQCNQSK